MPDTAHASHAAHARPRIRFGVRSLLTATTIACVLLALLAQPIIEARRQQSLLDQATSFGARIARIGSVSREQSLGRFLLAFFDSSYGHAPLYKLDFSGTELCDDELAQVLSIEHVRELDLSGTKITDAALRHLDQWDFLERLDLSATAVTDEGVLQLSDRRNLASLRVFGSQVGYGALERLDATLPYAHFSEEKAIEEAKAAGIQVVDFPRFHESPNGFHVVRSGGEAISAIAGMNRRLSLTAQDVLHLGYLQSLRDLTFHSVTLAPDGLNTLRPLANLKQVSIYYVNLSDNDLNALAKQTQLESLTIQGCPDITDAGLAQLKTLINLKELSIGTCQRVTKEGVASLAGELPDCECENSEW